MNEAIIVQQALKSYERLTGGKAVVIPAPEQEVADKVALDVRVELGYANYTIRLKAEAKARALKKFVLGLLKQQMEANGKELLIMPYVPDQLADALRKIKLNYLDTAGNMYIEQPGMLLLIQGQKRLSLPEPEPVKLFQPAGLQVLYQLIGFPEDPIMRHPINLPLRTLADMAGVSLGSVHKALTDLEHLGYVLRVNEKYKKLTNRQDLMNRWVVAYGETLRPKLYKGTFRFANERARQDWRTLKLNNTKTRWGGEPAAAKYTRHIEPDCFTLYTTESPEELMRHYRLLPQAEGEIEVLTYPAKKMDTGVYQGELFSVPPLLVYADLITTTDPRNHETAKLLAHDYLDYFA
jgi:hypothetical protein